MYWYIINHCKLFTAFSILKDGLNINYYLKYFNLRIIYEYSCEIQ